jgi:SAM-dependent methyltransferase
MVNIHGADRPPSPWLRQWVSLIRAGGRVLDLAAGEGRHTGFLLDKGFRVVAADRKTDLLRARFGAIPECVIVAIDLEDGAGWRLGGGFDGVIVSLYLHRPILPDLARALAPGGVLIYETFMVGTERFGRPTNPDFLLRPNELSDAFVPDLRIIAFEEGEVARPKPAMMQRLVAMRDAGIGGGT